MTASLTQGPITPTLLRFALPMMLGDLLQQRYNIAEKLMRKQSYTSIMGYIGASSAIISRVSRVLGRDDSVLRRILEKNGVSADTED